MSGLTAWLPALSSAACMRSASALACSCLEPGDALLEGRVVQISHSGFGGILEPVEPLVGLGDSPVEFGKVLPTALGAFHISRGPRVRSRPVF